MKHAQPPARRHTGFALDLPLWAVDELEKMPECIPSGEDRMAAVIKFSRMNFRKGTGGPFAAGVFERDTGRLLTIGVNRVVPLNCSCAHAEVMALSLAQKHLGTYDLGAAGFPAHQLVVNWRPCAMCFGAVLWSGIRSLMIAGAGSELEEITGFDEGPMHPGWRDELARRGIELVEDVLHEAALDVCREFSASHALVYNARLG